MDLSIRQGETLSLTITADDATAQNVTLTVRNDDEGVVITETASFSTVDDERIAEIQTNQTNIVLGVYEYMLTINYSDGVIEKLPDLSDCEDGDCELPTLTICEALDLGVS